MTAYFLDTSALVKRYVAEIGSAWVQALADPRTGNELHISQIAWVEVLSALARRQREGRLSATDLNGIVRDFRIHFNTQYQVVEIDQTLCEAAGQLILMYPLRAYDAVQLASGLQVQSRVASTSSPSLVFLSADDRLLAIAQPEGLPIDNPNYHP
ncbi:type II toxin-antitoxin system VapC family toxin [Coleofasciculus sp. H7-2]|uniref:type II toxin-antitoxin system VapC family toxin n=1 Tax=Coleofasciculus sp. H7-2 TaxID=3351545 RepID=UPI00366B416D